MLCYKSLVPCTCKGDIIDSGICCLYGNGWCIFIHLFWLGVSLFIYLLGGGWVYLYSFICLSAGVVE